MGDNLTGAGEGDDEQIIVELNKIPAEYDRIVIVVNIYEAVKREVYRHNGEWKFSAIGQATNDPGLSSLVNRYR